MANPNRLAGVCYLSVDGVSYMMSGDFSYKVSGVSRETLKGPDGVHGYAEKIEQGYIGATLRDSASLSLSDLNAMSNVTVVAELANGKTVIGSAMWTTDLPESKAADATIEMKWESASVTES
ncbi:phage tail tube protein [Pseudomonas sp. CCC3.2]|uniref:phage tail tube protein n=1 Tax=unclassified Pseudomonas TaxID=196821 RepID=UPI002AB4F8B6|nr:MULTISPECIES: phage tail tube protein [unclassified Pseudomonas]MDY7560219.1 phage tail tube protein [Pseudomonas sp. AB6]MEB0178768.1 phage tail tube protein [Pseudomonas sp. CCC3.2]MEB0211406.1 phage tail tube protein [Pseudomonas sp. AB6]